jgi:hypothetical protein
VIEKRTHEVSKNIFALAALLTNVNKAAEKAKGAEPTKAPEVRGGLFSRLTGRR